MEITKSNFNDFDIILKIYEKARLFMALHGNPDQWGNNFPTKDIILDDIQKGKSFLCKENGIIGAVFVFEIAPDPFYDDIYCGKWLNEDEYATVHRLASSRKIKGAAEFSLNWCSSKCRNIRIDTHEKNNEMQNLLRKLNFVYCGKIKIIDNTERIAFQKENY